MRRKFILFFSMLIALAVTTKAQWKKSPYAFNEGITALTVNNGILYGSTSMDAVYDNNIFTSS